MLSLLSALLTVLSVLLAFVACGCLYAAIPTEPSEALPQRRLRWSGGAAAVLALGCSVIAFGPGLGPVIVATVAMSAASAAAMADPLFAPEL
ncbi:MAG: hypothetical protein AAGI91_00285 [Bacteroidota bacterium]